MPPKVRKPSPAARALVEQQNARRQEEYGDALSPGDRIGYSTSMSVRMKGGREAWIKAEASSMVRPDEDATDAAERVISLCERIVDDRIGELES